MVSISANISANVEDMAVSTMMVEPQVLDAGVSRDGNQFSLVVIVPYSVNSQQAKQLGDSFVRLVKSLSPDDPPGRQIGTGVYDYVVGVYYPNEKPVARGAKSRVARSISW